MFRDLSKKSRWLMLVIAGTLGLVYWTPIWFINLEAPQYRDGLRLIIWLNQVTGGSEFDLKNINLLNHYVGMKEIHANDFIEFKYMPYVLGVMMAGALATFCYPKIIMVYLGLISFLTTATAGLYDFHRWEYNYGHNLDSNAALSIPGISFEPPLLGCKAMMNFNTCSWPHVGTFLLLLAGGIIGYVIFDETRKKRRKPSESL